jgi:DNA-binding NtrC family response regulator
MGQSQVLLVEDNQGVLQSVTEALRAEGYLVQPANSSDVALVLLEQHVPFRLLVTDIVLPGVLDGFALARRAKEVCPGIRIIYSTGYAEVAHVRASGAPYGETLIKPWSIDTMLSAISTALGEWSRAPLA